MNERRKNEWITIPKRKPRFFKSGNNWYYDTREGIVRGPFDFLPEAEMDAADYVQQKETENQESKVG